MRLRWPKDVFEGTWTQEGTSPVRQYHLYFEVTYLIDGVGSKGFNSDRNPENKMHGEGAFGPFLLMILILPTRLDPMTCSWSLLGC